MGILEKAYGQSSLAVWTMLDEPEWFWNRCQEEPRAENQVLLVMPMQGNRRTRMGSRLLPVQRGDHLQPVLMN